MEQFFRSRKRRIQPGHFDLELGQTGHAGRVEASDRAWAEGNRRFSTVGAATNVLAHAAARAAGQVAALGAGAYALLGGGGDEKKEVPMEELGQQPHMGAGQWAQHFLVAYSDHLFKMPKRRRIYKRKRRRLGKRRFKRRRYGVIKRSNKIKKSRRLFYGLTKKKYSPLQYNYDIGISVGSRQDGLCQFFVPMYDVKGVFDKPELGTGAGAENTSTCMSMNIEDPLTLRKMMLAGCFENASNVAMSDNTIFTRRFVLGPRKYSWQLTNFEAHPIRVEMYVCQPRHDIYQDSNGNFDPATENFCYQGTDFNDILARCFSRDNILAYATNTGILKSLPPGLSPFQSGSFCSMFKILKKRYLEMKPGACHQFTYSTKKPWYLSDWYIAEKNAMLAFGKKSMFLLFKTMGCPVIDSEENQKEWLGRQRLAIHYTFRTEVFAFDPKMRNYKHDHVAGPSGEPDPANVFYLAQPPVQAQPEN